MEVDYMMKKPRRILSIMFVGLFSICSLFGNNVSVAFAYNQAEYVSDADSDILTNIRLLQMGQYFEDSERVELVFNQSEGRLENEEVVPCTPASANPVSVCMGSACAGSICFGSGCGVSNCGGSACGASGCAGSLCAGCKK